MCSDLLSQPLGCLPVLVLGENSGQGLTHRILLRSSAQASTRGLDSAGVEVLVLGEQRDCDDGYTGRESADDCSTAAVAEDR